MNREEFKHGKLANGRIDYTFRVTASAESYAEGDILETSDGLTYAKAESVDITKHYVVCAEETILSDAGELVVYKGGYFNKAIVKVNGAEATADAINILKTQNIFVEDVAVQ